MTHRRWSLGDRSGATSDPTTSECSIADVAFATKAHAEFTSVEFPIGRYVQGNVPLRQLRVGPFRPRWRHAPVVVCQPDV